MNAVEELAALEAKVVEAEGLVRQVAANEKAAKQQLKVARQHLAEVEVAGTAKEVEAARQLLDQARQGVEVEPWRERAAVAQRRVGSARSAVRQYVRTHFVDLLTAKEVEGEAAAATMLAAAETLIAADRERYRVVGEIAGLWRMVATPRQGDVSGVTAQRLVTEASVLIDAAADAPPRLDRDRLAQALAAGEPVVEEEQAVA